MRTLYFRTLMSAAFVALTVPAHGQTVISDIGTTSRVLGIEESTNSNQMGGMRVSATFGNNTFSGFWSDLDGAGAGTVWGVDLFDGNTRMATISMNGPDDTFFSDWTVNLYRREPNLRSLRFEGGEGFGGVMFDRSSGFAGVIGTSGSSLGNDFDLAGDWRNVTATYSNAVGLGNALPVGDLYTQVFVDFSNARVCVLLVLCDNDVPDSGNNGMSFRMDTDRGRFPSGNTVVPEPSTYALMAAGLAALGMIARRRKRAA